MSFIETISAWPSTQQLGLNKCREAIQGLISELRDEVAGQDLMIRRIVQAAMLNGHVLVEGLPGEGKTRCVREFAERTGMTMRRIQFLPDMMPSDVIGKRYLTIPKAGGPPTLEWRPGPIFAPVVLADEINRASPRTQAATLEAMQERQVSLIDERKPLTVYRDEDRADLERLRGQTCFGLPVPDPNNKERVPFIVLATQNPIEMEGTYPLSEAQTDRFLFKLVLDPPDIRYYHKVIDINLRDLRESVTSAPQANCVPPPPTEQVPGDPVPTWLKSACFLEWVRRELLVKPGGMHQTLTEDQLGLFDRVCLILMLSHYRTTDAELVSGTEEGLLPASLRTKHQEDLRMCLALWYETSSSAPVRDAVQAVLTSPLFQYVESGSSRRGLIDWPRAAIMEAFLDGDDVLRRHHFRVVADDVLRHRIRLLPHARAEHVRTEDLIRLLVDALLPDPDDDKDHRKEDAENRQGLLPSAWLRVPRR